MFIHLRAHSYYSFLEALSSPRALARFAAGQGMPSLGLTDSAYLTGAVEFYEACLAEGIRPILGLQLRVAPPTELQAASSAGDMLAFLAMDLQGWASLCRLSSAVLAGTEGDLASGLTFEVLAQNAPGLICLAGGRDGQLAEWVLGGQKETASRYLDHLNDVFPDRLYVELQIHAPDDFDWVIPLSNLAHRLGLPVTATHQIHALTPAETGLQRLLTAIRLNQPLASLPEAAVAPPSAHFRSATEMEAAFAGLPDDLRRGALTAPQEIADRCHLELPLGVPHYPAVPVDSMESGSPLQTLRSRAFAGAASIYGKISADIRARLDHELTVIGECGYAPLFLIMEDILAFTRRQGIPMASRGSASSSLVAHCLGITSPDPLRLNLYFERFLNPARATPPDIDTDLCSRRRGEVIQYVYRRFGHERVAMVSTIVRFRFRSALRETAKAHGLPPAEIKILTDAIPHRWWGPPRTDGKDELPYAELRAAYPQYAALFDTAGAIQGLPRYLSVHPGGVVIAPSPLTNLIPIQLATKGVMVTQFDLESIERLGLLKIDLLGIRGLTVLGDVAQDLHSKRGRGSSGVLDELESIPQDDPDTASLVLSGQTIGCFQIESPGMRATLREIGARSADDLMVALALYRPGPLTGGLKDAFVRRHRGFEPVSHLHPALAPLLADTHGVILYQEQVLHIAHELAGLNLADADLLRRAMSHFDPGKAMRTLKEKFIAGAIGVSGVPEAVAERVWDLMAAFAGYGFPKAHAASYAQVAWRAAWCKAHHPAIFMAAVLANWGGFYSQRVYLTEAQRLDLPVRPPHINHARPEFCLRYLDGAEVLFMGLDQVHDLTHRTQVRIVRGQPFHSMTDFLARVDPRPAEVENLVKCGALEGMGTIPELLRQVGAGDWRGGQLPLFAFSGDGPAEDWSLAEQAAAQEAILGVSLAAHPLALYARQVEASGAITTVEAAARVGRQVWVAGLRQSWRRSRLPRGESVYFMALEDLDGMLDVVIFQDVYRRSRSVLSEKGPYLVEGVVELDQSTSEPFIRAERIQPLV